MSSISNTRETADAIPRGLHIPIVYGILIAAWAAGVAALSLNGTFIPVGSAPPPAIPVAILLPPALFLLAYRMMPSVRAWVSALDLGAVTALQGWRIMGGVFLFLWYYGDLPALFAWPAGLGDVLVGLAAPWVTAAVINKSAGWRRKSMTLIAAGLVDFVVAVASGVLTVTGAPLAVAGGPGSELVNAFPLVMVPAFFVPMFIIFHLIAWIKLRNEIRN
jgi:hypothetical protein